MQLHLSAKYLLLLLLGTTLLQAELRLPNVFGDGMVLQCDKPIRIWGWAKPGEKVTIALGNQSASATADENGKWNAELKSIAASFDGQQLKVSTGSSTLSYKDILIGEVWLCGGQSNMEWMLRGTRDADLEIDSAHYPAIRFLRIPKVAAGSPQDDFVVPEGNTHEGRWMPCIPEHAGLCSAVGYYFAKRLQQRLQVPIGLIDTSWGGTMAQFWVSEETLRPIPEMKSYFEAHEKAVAEWTDGDKEAGAKKRYEADLVAWEAKAKEAQEKGEKRPGGRPNSKNYIDPSSKAHPAAMYNGVLMPVAPYTIRGALFYQGENNSFGEAWKPFVKTYEAVVSDWRKAFKDETLPIGLLQIAGWSNRRSMSYDMNHHTNVVREVQHRTWEKTKNTGLIVTFDANRDGNIHPNVKAPVGERSARWALSTVYDVKRNGSQEPLEWRGPVYESASFSEGKAMIRFKKDTARGLKFDKDIVLGFYIAGEDKKFHIAKAKIHGSKGGDGQVEVWSSEVKEPKAVRYAQSNLPIGTLINGRILPAYPFRTDTWPITPHHSTGEYIAE
ncbi:MAG: sialate O-acetylesterase [Akkermansiaceae bacterium]